MILRNFGVRHGRRALAAPIRRSCLRALSTEPTIPTPIAVEDAAVNPPSVALQASEPQARFYNPAIPRPSTNEVPNNYLAFTKLQKQTAKLGSVMDKRYRPGDVLKNPPAPKDVSLELLMASQCHMGHNTSLWNPANARYIYGVRAGIHIMSLEQTAAHLRRAARVVEAVAHAGGLILFVGTRKGQMEIVTRAAELAGACHLFSKWTPGAITNRDQILGSGSLRLVDENDRPVEGYDEYLRDCRPLLPDLVVVLNPLENWILLHECELANIPTIGVIDTNADPTRVTYTIPANDDSLRSVAVIAGVLGRAGELGQTRRKRDAENGNVTWQNSDEFRKFLQSQGKRQQLEAEAAMAGASEQEKAFMQKMGVEPV